MQAKSSHFILFTVFFFLFVFFSLSFYSLLPLNPTFFILSSLNPAPHLFFHSPPPEMLYFGFLCSFSAEFIPILQVLASSWHLQVCTAMLQRRFISLALKLSLKIHVCIDFVFLSFSIFIKTWIQLLSPAYQ